MRLLPDTHALLWCLAGDPSLPETAHGLISNETVFDRYGVIRSW